MATALTVEAMVTLHPSTTAQTAAAIPKDVNFDPDTLKSKYFAERDKRLHNGGLNQYRPVEGSLSSYVEDPYVEPGFTRDPVDLDCDVVIIGGGYGGQLVAVRLMEQGINNFRIIEKGGDFGGTWYWNRYPGAQCDIESYIYMPLLEETNYIPTEKYAHAQELLDHSKRIGEQYDLYSRSLFQTEVLALRWCASDSRWSVDTSRKDNIRARFVIPVAGPLHRPKLPGLPGIESFQGHSFHSSRWDYNYTGGNEAGGLTKLADKRVGIIGTGATAVQLVPHLGAGAKDLYVFQRTPSSIDIRANRPTDWDWAKSLQKGWQQKRMDNFTIILSGGHQEEDLVADAWTNTLGKLRPNPIKMKTMAPEAYAAELELADFQKMESLRARVDAIVEDKRTAESLKPWYNHFCKRPCCHDEYLQTFNRPNVHLIDTEGQGVEAITTKGVVSHGKEYELDCIIYATGFEVATDFSRRAGMDIYGRDNLTLTEKWREGALTFHGWTTRGFPNCFFVSNLQSAQSVNFIHATNEQAIHLAYIVSECQKRGIDTVEPTAEAEANWVDTVIETTKMRRNLLRGCTPGYYNNEGDFSLRAQRNAPYGGGVMPFLEILSNWRQEGKLEGLDIVCRQSDAA
ncbi:uncharacterized protein Z519_05167 [Cladophialophora bantiana CBS 173.52]|uniref:FAD/NAD(P)-binding domain-containing protein n=1 Tax=Cladophialophora bantiana (strain ATCC 10958 / CBS 173.52 / CDC B-1940 / NIH 8579) TaxID=1442370 RepID=A0A0D2G5D8_CLAB1|nr:uncharacterized protein Z519_05167 [Cladophialophora bantiana CBS 173.52]KIW93852.1 hypothetical protein Z519_05167 [Cladophialophora bantiana CBS 173.52]